MNLTQNDRLKQVTSDTLIVGVDVGSQTHFCRAFDWRGFELSRRVFKFSNTGMGFLTFLRWTEELMNKTEMKKVIVGCEPTGCYWLTFQKFLQDHDVQLVTVNPFTVNRSMELDDNSPEKSDLKDPKTIALACERWKIFNFLSSKRCICRNQRGLCLQRSDHEAACTSVKSDTGMASEVLSRVF
ncbi:MAG: IS110 family transposase [Roseburia intestinalis]